MSIVSNPRSVISFDIETGQQEIVGEFPGMTFAPRFSPDGKKIVMSYSDPEIGNSEIYMLDLNTREYPKELLTIHQLMFLLVFLQMVKQIVFNSDRSGRRHLYVTMNLNGKK